MPKRVGLTKKVRFEVFKRDSFKCQYCGRAAPDAVLHVDHIQPVSKGGENEILNLVTSCLDCNSGKGAREISDDSIVAKQREQLDALNTRREQLQMLLQWRNGLRKLGDEALAAVCEAWEATAIGYHLNESGKMAARKHLASFGAAAVLAAISEAARYLQSDSNGAITKDSVEETWRKVGGICRMSSMGANERRLYYIRGICRNRFRYIMESECLSLLRRAHEAGADVDDLADLARCANSWVAWANSMDDIIGRLKRH